MKKATDSLTQSQDFLTRMTTSNPGIQLPNFSALHEAKRHKEKTDAGYASILFDRLIDQVRVFEEGLTDDEELGGHLTSFGTSLLIRVFKISFDDPFFIVFNGEIEGGDGSQVSLVQHCNQLNVLFTAVKKIDDSAPPRRIGFIAVAEDDH